MYATTAFIARNDAIFYQQRQWLLQQSAIKAVRNKQKYSVNVVLSDIRLWSMEYQIRAPCTKWMWRGTHASGACLVFFIEIAWNYCIALQCSSCILYFVHQLNKLLFWKSVFLSDNDMLALLALQIDFTQVSCLYDVTSRELSTSKTKHSV